MGQPLQPLLTTIRLSAVALNIVQASQKETRHRGNLPLGAREEANAGNRKES